MANQDDPFGINELFSGSNLPAVVNTYKPIDPMAEMAALVKERNAMDVLRSKQVEAQNRAAFDNELADKAMNFDVYKEKAIANIENKTGVKLIGKARTEFADGLYDEMYKSLKSDKRYAPLREHFTANTLKPSEMEALQASTLKEKAKLDKKSGDGASLLRGAGDMALSFVQGASGGIKSLTDLAGADNAVSSGLDRFSKFLEKGKDDYTLARTKFHADAIKKAEDSGDLQAEASAYIAKLYDQSGDTLAQGVGSFVPTIIAGLATGGAGAAASLGMTAAKYAKLAPYIQKATMAAFSAAQGVGSVKGSQYEQTFNNAVANGFDESTAKIMAAKASEYSSNNAGQQVLGGVLGAVAGATGPIEGTIAKVFAKKGIETGVEKAATEAAKKGILSRTASGFATEGLTEGAQGAQERYAGNLGAISQGVLDPSKSMQGVAGQGLSEGIVGGAIGSGAGAINLGGGSAPLRPDATFETDNQPITPPSATLTPQQRADLRAMPQEEAFTAYATTTGADLNDPEVYSAVLQEFEALRAEPTIQDGVAKGITAEVLSGYDEKTSPIRALKTTLTGVDKNTLFDGLTVGEDNDAATISAKVDDALGFISSAVSGKGNFSNYTEPEFVQILADKISYVEQVNAAIAADEALQAVTGEPTRTSAAKKVVVDADNATKATQVADAQKTAAETKAAKEAEILAKKQADEEARVSAIEAKQDAIAAKKQAIQDAKDLASKTAAEKKMSAQTKKEQDAAEVVGTRFIKTESQADAHDRLRTYSEVSGKPLADVVAKHAEDYVKKTGRTGQGGVKIEFQKDTLDVLNGTREPKPNYADALELGLSKDEAGAVAGIRKANESERDFQPRAKKAKAKYDVAIEKQGSAGNQMGKPQVTQLQQVPTAQLEQELQSLKQNSKEGAPNETKTTEGGQPIVETAPAVDAKLPEKVNANNTRANANRTDAGVDANVSSAVPTGMPIPDTNVQPDAVRKGRDEKYGIDVELKEVKDGYQITTSDENQKPIKVTYGGGGIYRNGEVLNMEGDFVKPSTIVQGGSGIPKPENTPFKGKTRKDNEAVTQLVADLEFAQQTGNKELAKRLQNKLIDILFGKTSAVDVESTTGSRAVVPSSEKAVPEKAKANLSQAKAVSSKVGRVLQNRNRQTPDSIAQMTAIAANPIFDKVADSREMASGAPVVFADSDSLPSNVVMGRKSTVLDGKNNRYDVQYAVVEADSVLASNLTDGSVVAEYEAGKPNTVRPVAGNGRAAGVKQAYANGNADNYKASLVSEAGNLGLDANAVNAMRSPVLVRVMPQAQVTDDIGDLSNISQTSALSPVDQAKNDAKRLQLDSLEFDDNGVKIGSVIAWINTLPTSEASGLRSTGTVSRQAIDRLNAAIFYKAYGSDELVRLYAEATDAEAKNIITAAGNAAPLMAQLEGAGEYDIRGAIVEAVGIAVAAKRKGIPLKNYLQTVDFTESGEGVAVALEFADNARSAKAMSQKLMTLAQGAIDAVELVKSNNEQSGFFEAAQPKTRQQLFGELNNAGQAATITERNQQRAGNVDAGNNEQAAENASNQGNNEQNGQERSTSEAEALTAPTRADVLAQQERAANATALDAQQQAITENQAQPLTQQTAPDQRTDNTSDMFALEKAQAEIAKANEGKAVEVDPNQNNLFASEPTVDYNGNYESDLFGNPLPQTQRKNRARQPAQEKLRGDIQPTSAISDTPAPIAEYYVNTIIGTETNREIGAAKVNTPEQAAQATAYLYKSAVERLDGIVTDKDGNPLAIIGGFKGSPTQTSVYQSTLLAEAVRIPGASLVWFSHNHPSGNANFSNADIRLNDFLANVFRGSGIESMGLLVVSGEKFSHVDTDGNIEQPQKIPPSTTKKSIPVIERKLGVGAPKQELTSATVAKGTGEVFYKNANEPGLILLNPQNAVVGWFPATASMRGVLRDTGGLNAIYRAISQSNAASAIIVHGGELDAMVGATGVTASENIAAALKQIDVTTLDSINVVTGISSAETGKKIAASTVFSKSTPTRNPTNEANIRSAIEGIFSGMKDAWARVSKSTVVIESDDITADMIPVDDKKSRESAQAFYQQSTGKIYLIADRIEKGTEASVWLHEVFHKRGEELLGKENLKKLHDNVQGWKTRKPDSVERQIYEAAHKRATDSGEYDAEFLTYAIEEANNRGVTPDASKGTITAAGWLAKVKSLFTNALRKLLSGYAGKMDISANDLMAMAYGAAKLEYEGKTDGAQGDGVLATSLTPFDGIEKARTPLGDTKTVTVDGKEYSVFNSDGKPIHGTVEGVRNFIRWFGDSKVTDNGKTMAQGGKPLVAYHGTSVSFDVFNPQASPASEGSKRGAIFLTSSPKWANEYALGGKINGGNVMPVYVKAENPFDFENAEHIELLEKYEKKNRYTERAIASYLGVKTGNWEYIEDRNVQKFIKSEGFDGFYVMEHGNKGLGIYSPAQIKSSTGNSGNFNPANPDIRFSLSEDISKKVDKVISNSQKAIESAKTGAQRVAALRTNDPAVKTALLARFSQMSDIGRAAYIKVLDQYAVSSLFKDYFKNPKGDYISQVADLVSMKSAEVAKNMARFNTDLMEKIDNTVDRAALEDVMDKATFIQYDPSGNTPKKTTATTAEEKALKAQYEKLSPQAKQVYRDVLRSNRDQFKRLIAAVGKTMDELGVDTAQSKALQEKMKLGQIDVYFAQNHGDGNYVVFATEKGKADHVFFRRYESKAEAEAEKAALAKENPSWTVSDVTAYQDLKKPIFNASTEDMLARFEARLKRDGKSDAEVSDAVQSMRDVISSAMVTKTEAMLRTRKNIAGARKDIKYTIRSFTAMESLIAKVKHQHKINKTIADAQKHIEANDGKKGYDKVAAQQALDAIRASVNFASDKGLGSQIADKINMVGYLTTIAANISSPLVNLTSLTNLALPDLGAKYGFAKAAKMMLVTAFKDVQANFTKQISEMTGDLKIVAEHAEKMNRDHFSNAKEMLDLANNTSPTMSKVMYFSGWMQSQSERAVNLQVMLTAYKLEMDRSGDQEKALAESIRAVNKGNPSNAAITRGAFAKSNIGRVVLMLKTYQINVLVQMVSQVSTVWKAAKDSGDPVKMEEARVAGKNLAGILIMHGITAGVIGLPYAVMVTLGAALQGAFGDEEDKNKPYDEWLKDFFYKHLGKENGSTLFYGILGAGISKRIGIGDLIFQERFAGRNEHEYVTDYVLQALGAGVSNINEIVKTISTWNKEREVMPADVANERAIKRLPMPAVSNILKGLQFQEDGGIAYTKDGTPLNTDENRLTGVDMLLQAIGFRPSTVAEATADRNAAYKVVTVVKAERAALLKAYKDMQNQLLRGVGSEEHVAEVEALIDAFNERFPAYEITEKSIKTADKKVKQQLSSVIADFNDKDEALVDDSKPWIFPK